jgi:transposase
MPQKLKFDHKEAQEMLKTMKVKDVAEHFNVSRQSIYDLAKGKNIGTAR